MRGPPAAQSAQVLDTPDQHDTYSVTRWMRQIDAASTLPECFQPPLRPAERTTATLEGWILGLH